MWKKSRSLLLCVASLQAQQKFVAEEVHMGTVFRITVYADKDPRDALRAAFDRVGELDGELSDYKPDSELMQLCRNRYGQPVTVSKDLYRVLKTALQLSEDSEGAFDVTLGPVIRLWRLKKVPQPERLREALRSVGYRNVVLGDCTVELKMRDMQIDLGAIAKGYAAEEALGVLRKRGLPKALVAASGDLAIGDPPPRKKGWTVSLEPLGERHVVELSNMSVGTSGDEEQFVQSNGVRYSHIVDPATGMGLTKRIGVSIIAQDGIVADALGTAVSVVTARKGIEAGRALAKKYGAEALIALDPLGAPEEKGDHRQDHE